MVVNEHFTEASFSMTRHAIKRAQQRGIKGDILNFVLDHADAEFHVGDGRFSIHISQRKLKRLQAEGHLASLIDRAKGITMVVDYSTSDIVSVMHMTNNKGARGYRKQLPTRNTKRAPHSAITASN